MRLHGRDFYSRIAALGGSKKGAPKGFAAMDKAKLIEASRKGGRASSRKNVTNKSEKDK